MANVIIYSTSTCLNCQILKSVLNDSGIEFTNIDVGADPSKVREMAERTGQMGVPAVITDGEPMGEYDLNKIRTKLGI